MTGAGGATVDVGRCLCGCCCCALDSFVGTGMHSRPVKCSAWMWLIVLCWVFHPTCLPYRQVTQTPQSCRVSQRTKGRRVGRGVRWNLPESEWVRCCSECMWIQARGEMSVSEKPRSLFSPQEVRLYFQTKTPDAAEERSLFSGVMCGVPPSLA